MSVTSQGHDLLFARDALGASNLLVVDDDISQQVVTDYSEKIRNWGNYGISNSNKLTLGDLGELFDLFGINQELKRRD